MTNKVVPNQQPTRDRIILFPKYPECDVLAHVVFHVEGLQYDLWISILNKPGLKKKSLIFRIYSSSEAINNFHFQASSSFVEKTIIKVMALYKECSHACGEESRFNVSEKMSDWLSSLLEQFLPEESSDES